MKGLRMKRKGWLIFGLVLAVALSTQIQSCAKKSAGNSTSATYGTTGTSGDYAEWTVSGSTLTGVWKVIDTAGALVKTLNVSATCGSADATYGYRVCTIDTGICTPVSGLTCAADDAPSPGKQFYMFEVPGVALMVKGKSESGTPALQEQLHVGLLKDSSCGSIAGDYTFMMTGINRRDLFGIYRTDANLTNVTHADFGMSYTGSEGSTPSVAYTTGGTTNGTDALGGTSCVDGVRERTISAGAATIRMAGTAAGAFVVDLPSGQGGLVAFKTTNAASLADFAGKTFGGISFPDNSSEQLLAATTGASTGSAVPITSLTMTGGGSPVILTDLAFKPATNTSGWAATAPAHPDFTATVSGYSANALQATYANPAAIPGLYVIDGSSFTASDRGRVFLVAMKSDGKVMAFGSVYNYRDHDSNGTTPTILVNTGAFILFEK
jgi:hypothetical protein